MSDQITAEERRLIDEAIARGVVTRCRIGESGLHDSLDYCPTRKTLVAQEIADGATYKPKSIRFGRRGKRPDPVVAKRRAKVRELHEKGLHRGQIAEKMGRTVAQVVHDAKQVELTLRIIPFEERNWVPAKRRGVKNDDGDGETIDEKKTRRAETKRAKLTDKRRFKEGRPASGKYSRLAPADATGTVFPGMVKDVAEASETVLKDGRWSQKIGGTVLTGRLKGAAIYTLTLEERATCPTSCKHLQGCYGGSMPHAIRWKHNAAFEERLAVEIAELCAAHENVLIRLHVLGDFYSPSYVRLWLDFLAMHKNLHVFGFTAWQEGSPIGDTVKRVRGIHPDRFMIRNSGRTGTWGSFDITDPFPEKTIGDAIVCVEQLEANLGPSTRHCGDCAACWSTDRPIAFIRH
jgi:hypothetical protein